MSSNPMPLVQVYAPDGTLGDIPYDKMHDAIAAGGKIAVKFQAPDGTAGFVPADRVQDAVKAGGKVIPFHVGDADGGKPGFWSNLGGDLKGMLTPGGVSPYPGMDLEAKQAIAQQSAAQDAQRKAAGYSSAYRALAPIGEALGVNAPGMEESAAQGDPAGVLGHAAAPAVALGGAEALHYGAPAIGQGIDTASDAAGTALRDPYGKLKPGVKAVAALGKLVGGPEMVNALIPDRPDAATAVERRAVPVSKNPNPAGYTGPPNAAQRAAQVQSPIATPETASAAPIASEGRPATWKNERVMELAAQGNRDAITQAVNRGMKLPENARYVAGDANFAGVTSNPRSVTLFTPEGKPIMLNAKGIQPAGVSGGTNIPLSSLAGDFFNSLGRTAPDVEVSGGRGPMSNASGESSASMEAQSRIAGEKSRGIQRVRIDTRTGNEIPLTGVDAVDAKAGPYDQIVMRDANGGEVVLDQGHQAKVRRPKQ